MIIPACFTYFRASRDGFRTKSNRIEFDCIRCCSIAFNWFDNRPHSKIDVRFCSITEPNRTIGVRLSWIEFWFDFVRLDTPGKFKMIN